MRHIQKIDSFSYIKETQETEDIRMAFQTLEGIMDKVNETYLLITEKYSEDEAALFEAGFLSNFKDRLAGWRQKAGEAGQKLGQTASNIKGDVTSAYNKSADWVSNKLQQGGELAKGAYNKGVELGQQAIQGIKDVCGKIADFFAEAWQKISSAPGEFWAKMQEGWTTVVNKLAEMKERASSKFQLEVGLILQDLNKKLCRKLRELTGDMQMGEYAIARKRPSDFIGKYEKFKGTLLAVGQELVKSGAEDVKAFGQKLLDTLQGGAENVGAFLLGLILAGIWVAGYVTRKLVNVGVSFSEVVQKFITEVKTEVPEIWTEIKGIPKDFVGGVKTGYQEGEAARKESHLIRFDKFLNE